MVKKQQKFNIDLATMLSALDKKDRQFYENLSAEQKKQFSFYRLLKFAANVRGSKELQSYVILATNQNLNRYYTNDANAQWLAATTISPSLGNLNHFWFDPMNGKKTEKDKLKQQLMAELSNTSERDIDLLLTINSSEEISEWLKTRQL